MVVADVSLERPSVDEPDKLEKHPAIRRLPMTITNWLTQYLGITAGYPAYVEQFIVVKVSDYIRRGSES